MGDVAELGCKDDLVAPTGERSPDELLIRVRAVHLGGVEEGDPELECAVNGANRLGVVGAGPGVEGRHPHAPESKLGDLEPAEGNVSHVHTLTAEGRSRET